MYNFWRAELYDPIRRKFVRATPEEKVRQYVIQMMVKELGYPPGLIAVEKELPGVSRRIDLLCYTPDESGLRPLLLVECKADPLDRQAYAQVFGYNEAIGAPFIALARGVGIETLWQEQGKIASVPFLPRYDDLLRQL